MNGTATIAVGFTRIVPANFRREGSRQTHSPIDVASSSELVAAWIIPTAGIAKRPPACSMNVRTNLLTGRSNALPQAQRTVRGGTLYILCARRFERALTRCCPQSNE